MPLLCLQKPVQPCGIFDLQLSWAVLKACSNFLAGEEGKTKGEFSCRQERAWNTVVEAVERAGLNMVVCEAGALVPGSNVLLIEEGGPSVFLGKFPFSFALECGWGKKQLPSVLVLQCIHHPADFGCLVLKAYFTLVHCFNCMTCWQGLLTSLCIGVALLHQLGGPPTWLGS